MRHKIHTKIFFIVTSTILDRFWKLVCSVFDILATKCHCIFQTEINRCLRSSTNCSSEFLSGLSSSRASSTRPLISGSQGWEHMFVHWLTEITVCLLNWVLFFFTKTLFRANFEFKGKHSHHSISICPKQLFWGFQGSVECYLGVKLDNLRYFVANTSKTLYINFYQNRSSIVEVMTANFGVCFMPHRVFGIIRGIEMYITFRSKSDWNQLAEVCRRSQSHGSTRACYYSSWLSAASSLYRTQK